MQAVIPVPMPHVFVLLSILVIAFVVWHSVGSKRRCVLCNAMTPNFVVALFFFLVGLLVLALILI